MNFVPERLITVREKLGINKAEAARRLNMSAMGYGRYEKGERIPSYQTLSFMAQIFGTTVEYLCGETDIASSDSITVHYADNPELFLLIDRLQKSSSDTYRHLLAYLDRL